MARGEVEIERCATEGMVADGLTKPLIGEAFRKLRSLMVKMD